MKTNTPRPIYLKDYKRPDFDIPEINLRFEIFEDKTLVTSVMTIKCRANINDPIPPLVLNGENFKLHSIKIDGKLLGEGQYLLAPEFLQINQVPRAFTLEVQNEIWPHENKALEGLFQSGNVICTQNEPEGFRRITYFIDRSDVMSKYTTTIVANKDKYPVLLSNGNLVGKGDLPDGRHWVKWMDPHKKPSYLFALVAGDLGLAEDVFTTRSGREVKLQVFVDKGNESKSLFALQSLKDAMKWDEEVYGLEYDLDIYMIVAVDSFNMGAMENKGLNIFNSAYVLADPKTATDINFLYVQGVVGHEYFHNWTGNRVTCRDWFQLTLKEGLTVFRDQEFSSDMYSRAVKRISDVKLLKERQFPEDSGPNAHPIRPTSYIEINNFYTRTVYEKGAEVIRMVHTLLGPKLFRKGMDLYFELFDGQAVTTEDFIGSMEKASGQDLTQFKLWYEQAGTPEVKVRTEYDHKKKEFTLTLEQSCPATPGQDKKLPFFFPFTVGLLGDQGQELPLKLKEGEMAHLAGEKNTSATLIVSKEGQRYVFEGVETAPFVSLNRNFSAPVRVKAPYSLSDLVFLMSHDSDPLNRWEASQGLFTSLMKNLIADKKAGRELVVPKEVEEAFGNLLVNGPQDQAFLSLLLELPSEITLIESMTPPDFQSIFEVREFLYTHLASKFEDKFLEIYHNCHEDTYTFSSLAVGKRDLKNTVLHYLCSLGGDKARKLAFKQFREAHNMTDEFAALLQLAHLDVPEREVALSEFASKWKGEMLVMNKWLAVQANSKLPGTLGKMQELLKHEAFDIKVPNCVRSLIGTFLQKNHVQFHEPSGEAYSFLGDFIIEMDKMNPNVASGLAQAFAMYERLDEQRKAKMKVTLEKILAAPNLSRNVFEIVSKTLGVK